MEILKNRCRDLIIKIRLHESDKYASQPLTRYILSIPCCIPVEHIILAERPYSTNIFPYAASAMSYDADLDMDTTPIVHFLALDISNASDLSYDTCRDWFRDSWKYLNKGILLLNVCTTYAFMDNRSEKERVAMEEFVRDIISVSLKVSDRKIHIYALGNPARHSAGRIRSSIVESKNRVSIHDCKNPAGFKHRTGDIMSPDFTMGYKSVTKLFTRLIADTIKSNKVLSEDDYFKMASGEADYNRLKEKSISSGDSFKEIAAYFKANTGKMVERNDELFDRAAEEMRQFVLALSAAKVKLLFSHISEPQGTSKPAYFNQRPSYNKANYSRGSSSKASVQTPGKKQSIGFADDDAPAEQPEAESNAGESAGTGSVINTPQTPTPQTPTPMRRPYAGSAAGMSSATRRTISVGFADDSDEEPVKTTASKMESLKVSGNTDFNVNISDDELRDLSIVSDFIDPSNEQYDVEPAVIEFIQESVRTKRAMSDISKELITIIRDTHNNPDERSISNALGYDDDIQNMASPIMQWVLKNVLKS